MFRLADIPEPIYEAKGCVVATQKLDPLAATTNCKLLLVEVLAYKPFNYIENKKILTIDEQHKKNMN
jgi:hypothetical protein